jgi:hypothetical protein
LGVGITDTEKGHAMPCHDESPLPPLPREGEDLRSFVRRHPPEAVARLVIEIHDGPYAPQAEDLTGEITQAMMDEFAHHSLEILLIYAEQLLAAHNPRLHGDVAMTAAAVLGQGNSRFEEIIWDELLRTSDVRCLEYLIERLEWIMDGDDLLFDATRATFRSYGTSYSTRAQMAHQVKLNRARHRAETMRTS